MTKGPETAVQKKNIYIYIVFKYIKLLKNALENLHRKLRFDLFFKHHYRNLGRLLEDLH